MSRSKYRITQSLISSYEWMFKKEEGGYEEFIAALNREKKPPTEAMLDGIRFENCLNGVLNGEAIHEDHEWFSPIVQMAAELAGSCQQVTLFREIEVDGEIFLVHGVLDYLKRGRIYDCKFAKRYSGETSPNKYLKSPQTSLYFYLVPEAESFTYIISDGKFVYREKYRPDEVQSAEVYIRRFMSFLKTHGLWEIYKEKWSIK